MEDSRTQRLVSLKMCLLSIQFCLPMVTHILQKTLRLQNNFPKWEEFDTLKQRDPKNNYRFSLHYSKKKMPTNSSKHLCFLSLQPSCAASRPFQVKSLQRGFMVETRRNVSSLLLETNGSSSQLSWVRGLSLAVGLATGTGLQRATGMGPVGQDLLRLLYST